LVKVDEVRLDDVPDFVLLGGDHTTLLQECDGQPPVAWETIRERLLE
jgi:hypothetical protein